MTIIAFFMVFCFPIQMIIGIVGNLFNLIVLLNRQMRSKTTVLLAMVALADILFLLSMFPHTLMFNKWLMSLYPSLKRHLLYSNRHITSAVNMCSFASAWLIVLVCGERMMAVIWPLRAKGFWTNWRNLTLIVVSIWVIGAVTSSHLYLTHHVVMVERNETSPNELTNDSEIVTKTALQATLRPGMQTFWRLATSLSIVFGVVLPVVLVVATNLALLLALHKRKLQSIARVKSERHRRVTLIVLVISGTFVMCQIPSALVHLWEIAWPHTGNSSGFRTVAVLSNFLVVSGKTANHFLFCLWSANFRANLRKIISSQFTKCFKKTSKKLEFRKMPIMSKTIETMATNRMSTPLLITAMAHKLIREEQF